MLEGLEKAVGPAKLSGEDDEVCHPQVFQVARGFAFTQPLVAYLSFLSLKSIIQVDESDKAYAEEVARGYKMTLKELFADIKRIDREIMADLDFTTKVAPFTNINK